MTDIEHPKMAGSGDQDSPQETPATDTAAAVSLANDGSGPGNMNHVKKHKRAHSRNKSISGRQDFLEEIANSEFKHSEPNHHEDEAGGGDSREKDKLLPGRTDTDHLLLGDQGMGNSEKNGRGGGGPHSPDETDALPPSLKYNYFDFFCTFLSILTYVVDVVMDCVVAYYFYHLAVDHGIYHYWYFSLTLVFIVLPSLTMTGFSFRWYYDLD